MFAISKVDTTFVFPFKNVITLKKTTKNERIKDGVRSFAVFRKERVRGLWFLVMLIIILVYVYVEQTQVMCVLRETCDAPPLSCPPHLSSNPFYL